MIDSPSSCQPRPATTVLLLRPSPTGDAALEVFMVLRNHQIDSFSGALVFPGGKLESADAAPALRARCPGAEGCSDEELAFRIAGVREAFEECGILLACKRGENELLSAAQLAPIEARWRAKLNSDAASIAELVEAEDLLLAVDRMVPFAHWITPDFVPKRFDTWFFAAVAPADQMALHDGSETVDSRWVAPATVLAEAKAGRHTLVFATEQNLHLLSQAGNVEQALEAARNRRIVAVQPWLEEIDGVRHLRIPADAGYARTSVAR
ncbi:NUDIX hydrolase [Pseudomonas cavernae]|uniref:NUDIX hydrolase n=1 Tax=Pseudomonas cavernae TaxID=2320867 RepID=A0A385Z010_9PSED|nr:NUDIX hydrolase [Pseudomonas cavernae]AYC32001.1 NUDIX hydrolase [Pseudomonas cavernae]